MVTIKDAGIEVSIVRETRSPGQRGFGALAFVEPVLTVSDRIKLYTSLSALQTDYAAGTEPYAAGLAFFAQSPTPKDFYVIQSEATSINKEAVGSVILTGTATASGTYELAIDSDIYPVAVTGTVTGTKATGTIDYASSPAATGDGDVVFTIDGVDYTYDPDAGDTGTIIGTEMASLISAGSTHTAVSVAGLVTVTDNNIGTLGNNAVFSGSTTDSTVTFVARNPTGGIDTITGDTGEDIALQLGVLVNLGDTHTAEVSGRSITLTAIDYGTAGNLVTFAEHTGVSGVVTTLTQPNNGQDLIVSGLVSTSLLAALGENPAFYAVSLNRAYRTIQTQMQDTAAWIEANERLFFATTNEALVLDDATTSDMASIFYAAGYTRSYMHYSSNEKEYPEVGAFALLATTSFRGTDTLKTLKFKALNLITDESIDADQLGALKSKRCNVVYSTAGIKMIDSGVMSGGGWADEIHGADALAEEIRVRVFGLLSRVSTKVPYTEGGMAMIKGEVVGSLNQYVRNGFLSDGVDSNGDYLEAFQVTSGLVSEASQVDKSARIAPDVEFWARLASAVHSVKVSGRLIL